MKKTLSKILPPLLFLVIFIFYIPLKKGFFQHDEIAAMVRYMSGNKNIIFLLKEAFAPFIAHYVPFHRLTTFLYLSVFGTNYSYYVLASIFFHLLITLLFYLFCRSLFNNNTLAFFAAAFFGLSASGHQATSWPLADINIHGAALFSLLSFCFVLRYASSSKKHDLLFSLLFLIISLLFKEVALAQFAVIPLFIYFIFEKKNIEKLKTATLFSVLGGTGYILFRLSLFLAPRNPVFQDQLVTASQTKTEVFFNVLSFPIKAFSQTLFPPSFLLLVARKASEILPNAITGIPGTTQFDIFIENKTLFAIEILILFFVAVSFFFLWKKRVKERKYFGLAVWGILFVFLNSLVYVLSPGRSGNIPVIDSRNLYFPAIGMAIFIVAFTKILFRANNIKIITVLVLITLLQSMWLAKEVKIVADRGATRRDILEKIQKDYPTLNRRTIFYVESDKSYYGLPENVKILPFQTNLGSNLFFVYLPTEKFPEELTENGWFLYNLEDQGYKEINGRGLGYFREYSLLQKSVEENDINPESVISYKFNSRDDSLTDISEEIRLRLLDQK